MSEAAFLRQLDAEPTDDVLRLVYADWLDEHAIKPGRPAGHISDALLCGRRGTLSRHDTRAA